MSLFDQVQRGDEAVLRVHQSIYNYLWDRWGLYVGTYRTVMIVLGFIDSIILDVIDAFDPKRGLVFAIPGLLFTFILIWLFFGRIHMGKEWKLQHEGKFNALNLTAMSSQGLAGLYLRFFFIALLVGVTLLIERSTFGLLLRYAGIFFFIMWSYSCGVMVRDREPDRFLKAVPQGT